MAATQETLHPREILVSEESPLGQFKELRRFLHSHIDRRAEMEAVLADWKSFAKEFSSENRAETRRAIAHWLLGQVEQAIPLLQASRASREKSYYLGLCYLDVGRNLEACEQLKEAVAADSGSPEIQLAYAEARIKTGDTEGAEGLLDRLEKKHEQEADVPYLRGLWYDLQGNSDKALEQYDRALALEPGHPRALFRIAYLHDLRGDDAAAMEYYQQLRKLRPVHVNTMMNLGVLYEDRGEYERAADCYKSILEYFPQHSRAKLYHGDAVAAMNMYYDEEAARREAKLKAMLSQPVGEITFSPRVRNALTKLDVRSLGDLCRKSEEDLMSIPNFGKTSLTEIKEFLATKGLALSSGEAVSLAAPAGADPAERPLSDFEWSGRLLKIFEALGFQTVGDLLKHTRRELLQMKNLGPTSIDEIQKRLSSLGMSLKD